MAALTGGCVNPFAPSLDEDLDQGTSLIADQSKVEGVFRNMQYAYTMRDTTIYGRLLSPDFTFTYRDYDKGFDVTWGRDDEMRATYGLFQNSQRLDLIWNNILLISGDSTGIVRSFNLTITFNPTDIQRADGKVSLILKKNSSTNYWQIERWVDESSF
ncbi:MAG TPA: hypothetical protein VHO03_12575 [Ignavibacteriales bacterium]|nr:hypothetical protein [Ignavibacteriales bacterium]